MCIMFVYRIHVIHLHFICLFYLNSLSERSGSNREMSLFLEELLSEEDFKYNFNNKEVSLRKTLALFTLKKKNDKHWKKQGYAFNNPGKEHAEALVLKKIESYIPDQAKEKYEMTLYISWTPCHVCSAKIQSLAARNEISIKIYASRRYYFDSDEVQKGLYLLKKTGVSLKMMDETDYEKCQKLFVSPCKRFTSWPGLEDESRNNTRELHKLWEQVMKVFILHLLLPSEVLYKNNKIKLQGSCSF